MLFNPQWNKKPKGKAKKVDPRFTAAALIPWLETKPQEESYSPFNNDMCMIGQYLQHIGWPEDDIAEKSFELGCKSPVLARIAGLKTLGTGNDNASCWTFGACLKRARAHVAK